MKVFKFWIVLTAVLASMTLPGSSSAAAPLVIEAPKSIQGAAGAWIPVRGVSFGDNINSTGYLITISAKDSSSLLRVDCTSVTPTYDYPADCKGKSISFFGSTSDVFTAIQTLEYQSGNIRSDSISVKLNPYYSGWTYFPGNGHYYKSEEHATNYYDARTWAKSFTFDGQTAYLPTVTTPAEDAFLHTIGNEFYTAGECITFGSFSWAIDADSPESGQPVTYTNWFSTEPNDNRGVIPCTSVILVGYNEGHVYGAHTEWFDVQPDTPFSYRVAELGSGSLPTTTKNIQVFLFAPTLSAQPAQLTLTTGSTSSIQVQVPVVRGLTTTTLNSSSSAESFVAVSKTSSINGGVANVTVTALSPGTATITFSAPGYTDSRVTVNVKAPPKTK